MYASILSSFIQHKSFYLEWLCICITALEVWMLKISYTHALLPDPLGPLAKGGTASLSITGTNVVRHMLN